MVNSSSWNGFASHPNGSVMGAHSVGWKANPIPFRKGALAWERWATGTWSTCWLSFTLEMVGADISTHPVGNECSLQRELGKPFLSPSEVTCDCQQPRGGLVHTPASHVLLQPLSGQGAWGVGTNLSHKWLWTDGNEHHGIDPGM